MKKILVIILLSFIAFSCGSDDNKNNNREKENAAGEESLMDTANEVEASIDKDRPFDLEYKFTQGEVAKYRLISNAITNQKIESEDSLVENEVTQTSRYLFTLKTLSSTDDEMKIDIKIDSLKVTANYNGEVVEFDSGKKIDEETLKKFPQYASFPDQNFTLIINKQGRIVDIENIDKIVSKYLEVQKIPTIEEEERIKLTGQIEDQLLQPLSQQLFKYLPDKPQKVDSTWSLTYPSDMGIFQLQNNAVSTLNKILETDGRLIAKIGTNLEVSVSGDGVVKRGDVTYNFSDPQINGRAETYFDIERGLVTKSETKTETTTTLTVEASNATLPTKTAKRTDIAVNTNTLELLEVN